MLRHGPVSPACPLRSGALLVPAAGGGLGPPDGPLVLLPGGGLALGGEPHLRNRGEADPGFLLVSPLYIHTYTPTSSTVTSNYI